MRLMGAKLKTLQEKNLKSIHISYFIAMFLLFRFKFKKKKNQQTNDVKREKTSSKTKFYFNK